MRVCPKCGHKDYPWKNRLHGLFTDYTHISELEVFDKQLAEKISESPKFYSDGLFNYRLKPDNFVSRIWKDDARHPTSLSEPPQEASVRLLRVAHEQHKITDEYSEETDDEYYRAFHTQTAKDAKEGA